MDKAKTKKLTEFERAERGIKHMSFEERVTLMKLLSQSMDGPRFFTPDEMRAACQMAIQDYVASQNMMAIGQKLIVPDRRLQ